MGLAGLQKIGAGGVGKMGTGGVGEMCADGLVGKRHFTILRKIFFD